MSKITKTFQYGKHQVTLETGEIARQAGGAVIVRVEDTVLLVSAGSKFMNRDHSILPIHCRWDRENGSVAHRERQKSVD